MARLSRVLRTDVMGDLDMRGLAQILRSAGRRGDTVLAHISPEEARRLKREGGSGTINPVTGLPEFASEFEYIPSEQYTPPPEQYAAAPEPTPQPVAVPTAAGYEPQAGGIPEPPIPPGYDPSAYYQPGMPETPYRAAPGGVVQPGAAADIPVVRPPVAGPPEVAGAPGGPSRRPTDEEKPGLVQRALTALQDPATLARLGLGIGGVGLGLSQQGGLRRAAAQGQAQYAALGQPYQRQGQEMIAAAQRGELTPQSQQAYQAAQAQIQQGITARGGVGAQQAAAALGNVYNQLLANQYSLGMNVAQIGDQYATRGIQAGLQGNADLQNTTANYYATLMRMFGGMPGSTPAATPTARG